MGEFDFQAALTKFEKLAVVDSGSASGSASLAPAAAPATAVPVVTKAYDKTKSFFDSFTVRAVLGVLFFPRIWRVILMFGFCLRGFDCWASVV